MNNAFRKVFEQSLRDQVAQNEKARQTLEVLFVNLRARTNEMIAQGAIPQAAMPMSSPIEPDFKPAANPITRKPVSAKWIQTVIQAANLDQTFLREVATKAAQIVAASLQENLVPATAGSDGVPTSNNPS